MSDGRFDPAESLVTNVSATVIRVGRFSVHAWLHTAHNPSAREWSTNIDRLVAAMQREGSAEITRALVISDGGAPDATQRARVRDELRYGAQVPSVVVTNALNNPVKRGVTTALRWMNPRWAFFSPEQIASALAHIDLENAWPKLNDAFNALQASMPPVKSLETATKLMAESQ